MFQNILGIKKYEHQILYNAMQVRETESAVTQIGVTPYIGGYWWSVAVCAAFSYTAITIQDVTSDS